MATKKEEGEKKVFVAKNAAELQKIRLNKLMSNPNKPVAIPDRPEEKLPRVFNPPEFVRNIWGSSAGAGSGDFHVYRGVRRREYARQKFLDQEQQKNDLDEAHREKVLKNAKEAEERTAKKRAKRQKKKMKQRLKKFKATQNSAQGEEKKKERAAEEEKQSSDEEESDVEKSVQETNSHTESEVTESRNETDNACNRSGRSQDDSDSVENSDDDCSQGQSEKEQKARLAAQPEDAEDNGSESNGETES